MGRSIEEQRQKIRAAKEAERKEDKIYEKQIKKEKSKPKIKIDHDYNSDGWAKKRKKILKRDGFICMKCGNKNNLVVHHKKYEIGKKLYEVPNNWLITWCESCHKAHHKKFGKKAYTIVNRMGENIRLKKKNNKNNRRAKRNFIKNLHSIKRTQ